jgi:hypothetical protein
MLNRDIYLMVALFQQIFQLGNAITDPVKYIEEHKYRIKAAGELLSYLGLAVPDSRSPLSWRPKVKLLNLVAKRMAGEKSGAKIVADQLLLDLLLERVFGERTFMDMRPGFGVDVLRALQLVKEDSADSLWVTQDLQDLFAERYYKDEAVRLER